MDSIQTGCPSSKRARFLRKRAACVCVAALALTAATPSASAANGRSVVLDIDGAIGPAIADYVKRELKVASSNGTRLVVLRMNTPGGLDTSMRAIIGAILASPVPVATFVAPNGARAASGHVRFTPNSDQKSRPVEERYLLRVDSQIKRSFSSKEPAITTGAKIKKAYPVVVVTVVDTHEHTTEIINA